MSPSEQCPSGSFPGTLVLLKYFAWTLVLLKYFACPASICFKFVKTNLEIRLHLSPIIQTSNFNICLKKKKHFSLTDLTKPPL